jgi:membrane-associated protein
MEIPGVYEIIKRFGYYGIFPIVFLEMGVFFCFFLPGDSLLLAAGALAAKGVFDLSILLFGISILSILAYWLNYGVGFYCAPWIRGLPDKFFYKRKYLDKTQAFYEKYGAWAIVIGRFLPLVRTFAPLLAGIVRMRFHRFTLVNALGGLVWGMGMVLAGYGLATAAPGILDHMGWLLIGIILLSVSPAIVAVVKRIRKYFKKRQAAG